jgi:hypothetical protein
MNVLRALTVICRYVAAKVLVDLTGHEIWRDNFESTSRIQMDIL